MGGSCEGFDGRGGEGVRRWRNGKGKKKEEGREKGKEKSWLSALPSIHPFIHISMHGCHAYYCHFKHDDQRKSHSAPH